MISKYLLTALTFIFLFTSCVKDLPIQQQKLEAIPVLTSFLNPDSLVAVHLYFSTSIADKDFPFIENATIALYEEEQFIENLEYRGKGRYESKNSYPIRGKTYKIVGEIPQYGTITGADQIPDFNVNVETEYNEQAYTDEYGDFLPSLKLTIRDFNENQRDFYDVLWIQKEDNTPEDNYRYRFEMTRADPIITAENIIEYDPHTIPFSDELFDGQIAHLEIVYTSIAHLGFGQDAPLPHVYAAGTYLHFRKISHNHYQFLKSWYRHLFNQATETRASYYQTLLFSEEPIELYSNIENGLGIVAAFQGKFIKLD